LSEGGNFSTTVKIDHDKEGFGNCFSVFFFSGGFFSPFGALTRFFPPVRERRQTSVITWMPSEQLDNVRRPVDIFVVLLLFYT